MRNQAIDKKFHYIKRLYHIYQEYLNLFTEEMAHNMNPGMIVLEKLDSKNKPVPFSSDKGQFIARWPAKLVLTRGDFR